MANTKVVTGKVRFCYLNAWEPKASEGSDRKVYSVSLVIPKSDDATIDAITKACVEAYEAGKEILKGNGKVVPDAESVKFPLRDGDKERPGDPIYANAWFLNATSQYAPGVVDANKEYITDHSQLYSGCYGRASIVFYAYNNRGNKGIACGLRNLQKLEDGEKLGGVTSAFEDFAD